MSVPIFSCNPDRNAVGLSCSTFTTFIRCFMCRTKRCVQGSGQ